MIIEVEEFFSGITTKECWSVIGGAGSGSVVSFRFGEKIRAKRPLRNAALTLEEQIFEGERSLILYCDWRIEDGSSILSTSHSTDLSGGIQTDALKRLRGQLVTTAGFTSPLNDLRVEFANGLALSAFCDVSSAEDDANYVMFNPSNCISVGATGEIRVEPR